MQLLGNRSSAPRGRIAVSLAVLSFACVTAPARAADAPVAGVLDLSLQAGPGVTAAGADALFSGTGKQLAGSSVAFAGDFNCDDRPDYAIGSKGAREVDVVYGQAFPEAAPISLPSDRGTRIFDASLGGAVAGVGDINGDGCDDLLVGSPGTTYTTRPGAGAAYLVFGAGNTDSGGISMRSHGARAVGVEGAAGDGLGNAVAKGPDLDGDGRAELLIGASKANAAYVVYSSTLGTFVDLAKPGTRAYRITGTAGDGTGTAVASAGDVNGDGLGDVVVGAPGTAAGSGAAYVVWGKPPQAATPVDLTSLGAQGFALFGTAGEQAGAAVAGIGDATRDGRPDIVVGAPQSSWNGRSKSGTVYLVPGRADTAPATLPAAGGLRIGGGDLSNHLGASLAATGDIDGDGVPDVAAGLPYVRWDVSAGTASALLLRLGQMQGPDVDGALLGYAAIRLAGPQPWPPGGPALAGGVDVDGDGRPDVLVGFGTHAGSAMLVRVPAPPNPPLTLPPVAPAKASNVEAVIDDSSSMRDADPGGDLRRQALEQLLVNPANQGRIFGAVEFGTSAHEIFPPLRVAADPRPADWLAVLDRLLAARVRNDEVNTNFAAGFAAAGVSNPDAQARVFITDGGQLSGLTSFGLVPTYVIELTKGPGHATLRQLSEASGGDYYAVPDGGGMQAALAAIDAALRGDAPLATSVVPAAGVTLVKPATPDTAAAAVTRSHASVTFATVARSPRSRSLKRARMVLSWNQRTTRFRIKTLEFRGAAGRARVPPAKLKRALRGHWQHLAHGLQIRGRAGLTYIALDVRGISHGGRRAAIASQSWGARGSYGRSHGSRRVIVQCLWVFQPRPH